MNSTDPENNASTVLVDEHDVVVVVAVDNVETTSVGASQTVLEKEGNATVPFFASVESRKKPSTPVSSGVGVVRDHHRDDCGETKHKRDETNVSPASTSTSTSSTSTSSTSTSTSSTSKPAIERERFQDRVLSRRNALRYGVAVTGAALITGLAHTQTSVEENLPPPPYRLSLWPKPVLPINKNGPGEKQLPQHKHQQPRSQSQSQPQPQPKQKEAPSKTTATVSKTAPTPAPLPAKTPSPTVASPGRLDTVNLTKVVSETNINVTMACTDRCLSIDSSNFTFNKIETPKVPNWLPSFLAPKAQVVKQYSNSELLVAATAAGSICEMGRTSLLYPLSTIKTRIQADRNDAAPGPTSLSNEVRTLGTNVRQKIADGDLWAGISPTLLVSVPATGIYYGVRDVTKRMLYMTPLDSTSIALGGALVGDVVSLCFRTPSNALAIRLQAQNETAGDWLGDSVRRLPMVILTDLPYLMSKIVLNKMFIRGSLPVSDYALYAILAAVVAGFLTTPFDVARTRILLDERLVIAEEDVEGDADVDVDVFAYSNGREGIVDRPPTTPHPNSDFEQAKADADAEHPTTPSIAITRPDYGLIQTMIQIANEGEGGVRNLFSGWLERVIYLGIGRAWLEPIQLIGYIGIRDAVLLQWF